MTDLDKFMFRREHFPIVLTETMGGCGKFWDFRRIEIPPYHPSMAQNGINFGLVPDLLETVLEETVKDLEEIADRRKDVQAILKYVKRDKKTGKIISNHKILDRTDLDIKFDSVPIVDHFWVGKKRINPYCSWGGHGIAIHPEHSAKQFIVPEGVEFSPELMIEYEIEDERAYSSGLKIIECPHGWYRHNLGRLDAIFYKNLVIALDNEVVKEEYRRLNKRHKSKSRNFFFYY